MWGQVDHKPTSELMKSCKENSQIWCFTFVHLSTLSCPKACFLYNIESFTFSQDIKAEVSCELLQTQVKKKKR